MNFCANCFSKELFHSLLKPTRTLPLMAHQFRRLHLSYLEVYHEWTHKFAESGISEPKESAGYIMAHLMGLKTFSVIPSKLLMEEMPLKQVEMMNNLCHKRLRSMPIQYIIGEWDFYGITLKMRPPVLIPRPETEELADHVLQDVKRKLRSTKERCKVLEVGSGTGAVTLSLLKKLESENVSFVAIDCAEHAYALSVENAEFLGLKNSPKLNILLHEMVGEGADDVLSKIGPFDIIVSNPPYIPTDDMETLPDEIASRYEDCNALHGGRTGMDVIHVILCNARSLLKKHGSVWLEVHRAHYPVIADRYVDFCSISYKDIFGNDRFCHSTYSRDIT